eukprot:m.47590 g.47590  ORF g.47590 m.47590 type:complete len:85 (+) comp14876_c0_seq5:201-455(+)
MMGGMEAKMHAVSKISLKYLNAHCMAVDNIGETVDESMRAMASLIANCNNISEHMAPVEQLLAQIKTVKRTLDVMEQACAAPRP